MYWSEGQCERETFRESRESPRAARAGFCFRRLFKKLGQGLGLRVWGLALRVTDSFFFNVCTQNNLQVIRSGLDLDPSNNGYASVHCMHFHCVRTYID